ncbi:unnamed protein product [Darwinula stevensoni]|uniref:alpha-1,2-Mannosidase n=1 Tax=Darwinula stevensoni TaxID=69355 RepID=A0A7R8X283_9CRUS|nr:unnamed protein product [Darwinula stevensoni]CAG0883021.1 unnamed protein product [Darwinula stevensoni]
MNVIRVHTFWCLMVFLSEAYISSSHNAQPITKEEKKELREEAKEMFYHAYNSYMLHAYPADELMPLSCKGRYRGSEQSRGDIDEAIGKLAALVQSFAVRLTLKPLSFNSFVLFNCFIFSLTLVDTMDTLAILGDLDEFEKAVKLASNITFARDVIVSVFETNIRMVGGLLSGHILASYMQDRLGRLRWYRGELLNLAKELGYRLLPAFNTSTGLPYAKVNLLHGLPQELLAGCRETCTACAGTMILEFGALSRLTGEPIFEEKARRALDALWHLRHRASDLVGTVLNIHNGDWVRRDSGVGAGIDSYYEYLLKGYILLGEDKYLNRFNRHYQAVMKYVSQGPLLIDVHMHRPHTNARNFMDALLAFWPGLQVLKGDIKPAIETHEVLYQVMQRHNFIPEAFTTDFQVHWGQHPLRPEFLESTYLLYHATGDPYYLEVGKKVLKSLQIHARVPCGFAAVSDVRTGVHEDRMDSFVLAETFKYLYLLFAEPEELLLDLDQFIFTTEAHLLPLSLARLSNVTAIPVPEGKEDSFLYDVIEEDDLTCPNIHFLFPEDSEKFASRIREPLQHLVEDVFPPSRMPIKRRLRASQFQAANQEHLKLLQEMGISIMVLPDGRVQLSHTAANAKNPEAAHEGLLFMQEMVDISATSGPESVPKMVSWTVSLGEGVIALDGVEAGPAHFGHEIKEGEIVSGQAVLVEPFHVCSDIQNNGELIGKIAVMERGNCMFVDKARRVEKAGAIGGIVVDNVSGTSSATSPMFAMSGDGTNDVNIPLLFLFETEGQKLLSAIAHSSSLEVMLSAKLPHLSAKKETVKELVVDQDAAAIGEIPGPAEDKTIQAMRQSVKRHLEEKIQEET